MTSSRWGWLAGLGVLLALPMAVAQTLPPSAEEITVTGRRAPEGERWKRDPGEPYRTPEAYVQSREACILESVEPLRPVAPQDLESAMRPVPTGLPTVGDPSRAWAIASAFVALKDLIKATDALR